MVYEIHNNTYKDNSSYTNEYELLLVGKTESGFYPLPMQENSIRKASAQRAKVVDNFEELQKELTDTEDSINEMVEYVDKLFHSDSFERCNELRRKVIEKEIVRKG